jgi:DNA-binding NarL/FixJ family response regulator
MLDASGRTVVHVVEPQDLFVPALLDVFSEAGLFVDHVSRAVDPRRLLDAQPHVVFLDTDYLPDPIESVRLAHVLVPHAQIFVYSHATTEALRRSFTGAGAEVVFTKSAPRGEIVAGLREAERHRR